MFCFSFEGGGEVGGSQIFNLAFRVLSLGFVFPLTPEERSPK